MQLPVLSKASRGRRLERGKNPPSPLPGTIVYKNIPIRTKKSKAPLLGHKVTLFEMKMFVVSKNQTVYHIYLLVTRSVLKNAKREVR